MNVGHSLRPATPSDEAFLREMLCEALFVPPGEPPYPLSVVDRPDLAQYVDDFGQLPGDRGWIVEATSGEPLGAAWVRLVAGYGFVDGGTPELSIALLPERRGAGLGSMLLDHLLEAIPRCSLSTDERDPAVRLYARAGFRVAASGGHSLTMLRP